MSGFLFWWYDSSRFLWEFRTDDRSRVVIAVAAEIIWEAREEPGKSGLQGFLRDRGIDPLPERAFQDAA